MCSSTRFKVSSVSFVFKSGKVSTLRGVNPIDPALVADSGSRLMDPALGGTADADADVVSLKLVFAVRDP